MECPHGEPHPSVCVDCIEGPPPAKMKAVAVTEITAKFDGQCSCGNTITAGVTKIYKVGDGGWYCGLCAAPDKGFSLDG